MNIDRLIQTLRQLDMAPDLIEPLIGRIEAEGLTDEVKDEVLVLLRQAVSAAHIEGATFHEALDTIADARRQFDQLDLQADRDFQTIYTDTRDQLGIQPDQLPDSSFPRPTLEDLKPKARSAASEWPDDLAQTNVATSPDVLVQPPVPASPILPPLTQEPAVLSLLAASPTSTAMMDSNPTSSVVVPPTVDIQPTVAAVSPLPTSQPTVPAILPDATPTPLIAPLAAIPEQPVVQPAPVAPSVPTTQVVPVSTPTAAPVPDGAAPDSIDWLSLLSDDVPAQASPAPVAPTSAPGVVEAPSNPPVAPSIPLAPVVSAPPTMPVAQPTSV